MEMERKREEGVLQKEEEREEEEMEKDMEREEEDDDLEMERKREEDVLQKEEEREEEDEEEKDPRRDRFLASGRLTFQFPVSFRFSFAFQLLSRSLIPLVLCRLHKLRVRNVGFTFTFQLLSRSLFCWSCTQTMG